MTMKQVVGFKHFVKRVDPEFYAIMDSVCIFSRDEEDEDNCYLMENAFGPVRPTPDNVIKYTTLLKQCKKENRIYEPIPTM